MDSNSIEMNIDPIQDNTFYNETEMMILVSANDSKVAKKSKEKLTTSVNMLNLSFGKISDIRKSPDTSGLINLSTDIVIKEKGSRNDRLSKVESKIGKKNMFQTFQEQKKKRQFAFAKCMPEIKVNREKTGAKRT